MSFDPAEPPIPDDPEEEIIPYIGSPKLKPVAYKTGEEDENCIGSFQCKIYIQKNDEWKQRGQGILKFLQHKQTNKCRLLMRQDATYFIRANHLITEKLEKSQFHQYGYEWNGIDKSFDEEKNINFQIKLQNQEDYDKFQQIYEQSRINNKEED